MPREDVAVVLGLNVVVLATYSCAGPITMIGAPFAEVPSCVCPVEELKADSTASNSLSNAVASMILPFEISSVISCLI